MLNNIKTVRLTAVCMIFLLFSVSSYTQVREVSGIISADSTWSDTIMVTGDINVVDTATLIIEPKTYIKFMGHYKLNIEGTLLAVGTADDSIWFTVNDTSGFHNYDSPEGGWNGVIFNNSHDLGGAQGKMNDNDTSKIQYCHFEFAKGLINNFVGSGGAVRLDMFNRLVISNSSFENNTTLFCGAAIHCYRGSNILIKENFIHHNISRRGGAVGIIDSETRVLRNTITYNTCMWGEGLGGAIYVETRKPWIEGNIIKYNTALDGGGIGLFVSSAYVIGNDISHNSTFQNGQGGGIFFLEGSSGEVYNNAITNNIAEFGGGIHCMNSSPTLINNLFANDTAYNEGGAITMNQANPVFINNTVVNSYAGSVGGGLDCVASNPVIYNTVFWGNSAGSNGDQVMIWEAFSIPEFYHCNIEGGTAGIGGFLSWRPFENNISEDPLFLDPDSDWHIADNSPNVNSGTPDISDLNLPDTDLDGNIRLMHNIVDIGAYEVNIPSIKAIGTVTVNTTWIADTVKVESDIVVNDDITLTILPGTYVEFQGHHYLKVMGTLSAKGTEDNNIVFTINDTLGYSDSDTTSGTWGSIIFDNSGSGANGSMWDNDTSVLSWCRLEYSMTDYPSYDKSGGAIAILYLDQLIIENCEIINNIAPLNGGGIFGLKTRAVIRDNIISNNYSFSEGGGIYMRISEASILNNQIRHNEAFYSGGAIHVSSGSPLIEGNTITRNLAGEWGGGGIMSNNGSPLIGGNLISNNSTPSGWGGGISIREQEATVINNVIVNNFAQEGAGIFYSTFDTPLLLNNTIANNRSTNAGGGITVIGATLYCYNNIFWGNRASWDRQINIADVLASADIINCNVEGGKGDIYILNPEGVFPGTYEGNLDTVPNFRNPSDGAGSWIDGTQSDWSLSPVSPCINSGITDITGGDIPVTDFAGNDRIFWEEIDMGAFENHYGKPVIAKNPINRVVCTGDSVTMIIQTFDTVIVQWQKDGEDITGAIQYELNFDSVEVQDDGNYQAIVSNAFGSVMSTPVYMVARSKPEIILQPENLWTIENRKNILMTEGAGTPPLSYSWYKNGELIPGKHYPELWIQDPDSTYEGDYHAVVTNSCGSATTDHIQVYMAPQLCMVTVDTAGGVDKNLVIWEKSSSAPILQYNIYRESHMAGNYSLIGSVPYENLSEFVDEEADPGSQAYWYKITAVDTAGNESPLDACLPHKTIHLLVTVNPETGGIQLDWDNYIGFNYATYDILSRNISLNETSFTTAHLMASSTSTWSAPSIRDIVYFRVTVERPEPCSSAGSLKAGSGPYSHALSNTEDNRLQSTDAEGKVYEINSVHPNPFSHSATIRFDNPAGSKYTLYMYNISGKICRVVHHIQSPEYILRKEDLKPGIYFVELRGPEIFRSKVVVE